MLGVNNQSLEEQLELEKQIADEKAKQKSEMEEIIRNNNNGIIFDLNKGSLKHSLERLDTNIELRKSIALNAREETNSKFSIDKAAMSEYDDYKLVLGL